MKKLNNEMAQFFRELYAGEEKVLVFGEGAKKARIMLVGEAPGAQEALLGRPFVGKAGKNLDEFLEISGFRREELTHQRPPAGPPGFPPRAEPLPHALPRGGSDSGPGSKRRSRASSPNAW